MAETRPTATAAAETCIKCTTREEWQFYFHGWLHCYA